MNTFILIVLLKGFAGAIALFITGFVIKILHKIDKKIGLDIDLKTEERIKDIVRVVVLELNQTVVDILKKQGKFDGNAQEQILRTAVTRIKIAVIKELGLDINNAKLESLVEATLGENKRTLEIRGNKGYLIKNGQSTSIEK